MTVSVPGQLRTQAPWRAISGFGGAIRSAGRYVTVTSVKALQEVMGQARESGLTIAWRGSGRSYGDAALNSDGLVVDITGMSRILHWDPAAGVIAAEGGVTIEQLWRRTLPDGFWPAVVPGTMRPTLAGCLSMNIHGKNNFKVGTFGEHVLDFQLLTPGGALLTCSREENPDLFHAAVGGLGLLGVVTSLRLRLKRVETGLLRVKVRVAGTLGELLDIFEAELPQSDYAVGWVDCMARGRGLGRGILHVAEDVAADDALRGEHSLSLEAQKLPTSILGVPRALLWRLMEPLTNDVGVRVINALRYSVSRLQEGDSYLQSQVAFAFLLDYVPQWWRAYGREGLIQVQVFLPRAAARGTLETLLQLCQREGLPPYLGVLKRHRPDPFLLSHALEGWSLAMDFRVTRANRERLWALTARVTEQVLDVGGRFYFAKDAVLRSEDVERMFGAEPLRQFRALRDTVDPERLLSSGLSRRVLK